jgi:WD40 repeat protein/serine/threonine protein kinase
MSRTQCLTHDELTAFSLGELPETTLEEMAAHLEGCAQCEAAARDLDTLSDPVMTAFRESALAGPLPAPAVLPERVGDYQILAEVGRGGMGVVYRARHLKLNRIVALKMLLSGSFTYHEERARFRAEAEAVARLHHANIVQIYEIGEHDMDVGLSRPFFTLEFVEGGNLATRAAGRPQPPGEAAAWIEILARAIHYAHEQGIVHRDLKPSNVLLTADGQPKICDFGVAKLQTRSDIRTQSGMLIGTAEYMAPEQAAGSAPPGPPADIYALGAILYTLLTGRPPFQGASPLHTLEQVRLQEPVTPGRLQPRIPRDLETICLKCLEKEPRNRYASALDLADDLRRFLCDEPIKARRASLPERVGRWARRNKTLASALVAVISTLAAATVISVFAAVQKETERLKARNAEAQAVTAQKVAEEQRDLAMRNLYVANTNLTGMTLDAPGGLSQVAHLLREWRGLAAHNDPRGWEWFYCQTLTGLGQLTLHGHTVDASALAWSADGTRLASGGFDGTIRIWDAVTGKQISSIPSAPGVLSVAWRPDGRQLASANFPDKTVSIWEPATGKRLRTLTGHSADVWAVDWSPDGSRLASADAATNVIVWDAAIGKPLFTLKGTAASHGCVSWSPDGLRLATANWGPTIKLWDTASGRELAAFSGHKGPVFAMCWNPAGTKLASASQDQTITIWDGVTGQPLRRLSNPQVEEFPGALCWSPDGRRLAAGARDLTIPVWDVASGERQLLLRGHTASHIDTVCWSPDGKRLASAERGWNGTIKIWQLETTPEPLTFSVGTGAEGPTELCWSPDSRTLTTSHRDGSVRTWCGESGVNLATLRNHDKVVRHVCWSPDGTMLASGSDNTVQVRDAKTGRVLTTLSGDGHAIASLTWSQDSRRLAYGEDDTSIVIWEVATASRRPLGKRGIGGVLNPRGDRLALGDSYKIRIIDADSGAEIKSWSNSEVCHNNPRWSPDGTRVASPSDYAVEVRNAATGLASFYPLAHSSHVEAFAWSPDGTQIVTGTEDNNLHLWDAVTGNPILMLRGPTAKIISVAWSPDATRIAVCSTDGTVMIWDATPGFQAERAAALLESLSKRIAEMPQDGEALRLRAGVYARLDQWDNAAADVNRLAAVESPSEQGFFQAGWWISEPTGLDSPAPALDASSLFSGTADPTAAGSADPAPVHWYVSADDPNGYVPLAKSQPLYLTRIYAPQPQAVAMRLEVDSKLRAALWVDGASVPDHALASLPLTAGWHTVVVRLQEQSPSSSVLLRPRIGFYLRLQSATTH